MRLAAHPIRASLPQRRAGVIAERGQIFLHQGIGCGELFFGQLALPDELTHGVPIVAGLPTRFVPRRAGLASEDYT